MFTQEIRAANIQRRCLEAVKRCLIHPPSSESSLVHLIVVFSVVWSHHQHLVQPTSGTPCVQTGNSPSEWRRVQSAASQGLDSWTHIGHFNIYNFISTFLLILRLQVEAETPPGDRQVIHQIKYLDLIFLLSKRCLMNLFRVQLHF